MKITQGDYDKLKSFIAPLGWRIQAHREFLKSQRNVKDIEVRLAWDCAHDGQADNFICNELYKYLDDTHITTALKAIIREIREKHHES